MRLKILVLGERVTRESIGEQLRIEGFETVFAGEYGMDSFPNSPDSQSLQEVRKLFKLFADQVKGGWVHPGATLWAERPELSTFAEAFGLVYVGPSTRVISLFRNHLNFLHQAHQLRIPHLVLSFDPICSIREVKNFVSQYNPRFPFVLKAVQGSAHLGLCVIHEWEELEQKLPLWNDQLRNHTGEVLFFAERYIEAARLLTVPFARFTNGDLHFFPIVDASLQSRNRKIIEICPASFVDDVLKLKLEKWVTQIGEKLNYVGVGALEFLVDGDQVFIIRGMPRLNTGFQLWDNVEGSRAVAWQIATLRNQILEPLYHRRERHGVSVRIYSENTLLQLPQPGWVHEISPFEKEEFSEQKVTLRLNYNAGELMNSSDSGIIGMLQVIGSNRQQVFEKAKESLKKVWIAGSIQTNERLILELLNHPWVREEIFHAGFIDEEFVPMTQPSSELIRVFGAICGTHLKNQSSISPVTRWNVADRWAASSEGSVLWTDGPHFWTFHDRPGVSGSVKLTSGEIVRVCAFPIGERRYVRLGEWFMTLRPMDELSQSEKSMMTLVALTSGRVYSILFKQHTWVPRHTTILIIESLGTLVPHAFPYKIRIHAWKVSPGDEVHIGQDLASFEILRIFEGIQNH